ncbi:class I poly(R)-hydroxyalkanoic acid synthase [Chitinasiproducens palmae]|uniref:Polyhydroxyalkanoate synthase n=1 Tax=Chitinasiproducens palmae TaxID=1770053 RepID=A0A1H2PVR0_9BURK|nr:class I poly(R)-hydroxyalkanoic acid synthase [Chitinasiproducens palmae]SDV51396.1 polyhydroxyalkanoate synthase [Chitinasiproducens palmae]
MSTTTADHDTQAPAAAQPAHLLSFGGDLENLIDPERLAALQASYARDFAALNAALARGEVPSGFDDKRFVDTAWQAQPGSAGIAAIYLLNSRYLHALADAVEGGRKQRERIRFMVEQWTAAAAPSNFLMTNPRAMQALVESEGETLRKGIGQWLSDAANGQILQVDPTPFKVGESLAVTPGAVVYENRLFQLIQYRPVTPSVQARPLIIVPPCINKFYILDLQPKNSLVRGALEAGFQVFMVSWRNPDESLAGLSWDDYIGDGVLAAIDATRAISASDTVNAMGFCVGGTLLATAAAVAAARGEQPCESITLLTTMLDFADTGVLDVFIDEDHVSMRERTIGSLAPKPGLMRGTEFARTFSMLRPNDLVWPFVIDNYLLGKTPPAFDLLYWNADSTNLPGAMFGWYLRHTYLENRLREPDALEVCGVPVDFGRIRCPAFIFASREDHIVPWQTAYASRQLLGGESTFLLGASGHIAGVINPPAANKRHYWAAPSAAADASADAWLGQATRAAGSWWPAWHAWLGQHGGGEVPARESLGAAGYEPIEPAPGRYVAEPA